MNLTRYNPVKLSNAIDEMFKGFLLSPIQLNNQTDIEMKMDVSEDEKSYVVRAELPGVKKEDIQLSITGNQVSIIAETKQEKEEKKGEKVIWRERSQGKIYRSFSLDREIDENTAQAKFTDGVLELTLPKKAGSASKRIAIT